jgi:hypothetical protein
MQVLSDFAAERCRVVGGAQAQVSAARSETDALRRLLRIKGREVARLRQLAQQVLLQRSEVEIFLLSSLQQVRAWGQDGRRSHRKVQGRALLVCACSGVECVCVWGGGVATTSRPAINRPSVAIITPYMLVVGPL